MAESSRDREFFPDELVDVENAKPRISVPGWDSLRFGTWVYSHPGHVRAGQELASPTYPGSRTRAGLCNTDLTTSQDFIDLGYPRLEASG